MNLRFDFIGPINDENILTLRNFIYQHDQITSLTINISSLGGTVYSGITIYNLLKQMTFPITTHNLGEVASSAILLYLAGTTRTAESISKFMIHPISIGVNGDLPYYKVQELLNGIDADINNFLSIMNKETNGFNGLYDIEHYLKNDSLALDLLNAYKCGLVTNM
ncbi:MAG: ATP-dependent Clp protease proteolytic subunit [Lachnospiraceae bacterium]